MSLLTKERNLQPLGYKSEDLTGKSNLMAWQDMQNVRQHKTKTKIKWFWDYKHECRCPKVYLIALSLSITIFDIFFVCPYYSLAYLFKFNIVYLRTIPFIFTGDSFGNYHKRYAQFMPNYHVTHLDLYLSLDKSLTCLCVSILSSTTEIAP